jgi:hypothetical protein
MWGKTRRSTRYYLCQISHQRAAHLPADHPPSVYLGERKLNEAILGFLATAVFGPDREEYWRHALAVAAEAEPRAPTLGRTEELTREIADLEGRLERQVVGLESEDVTPALRRRVAQRVAELEEAISERQKRLDRLAAQAPPEAPQADDVATVLARLPVIADRLRELSQGELRAMLEALQLTATYLPERHEVDIELALQDDGGSWPNVSEVWSVPPGGARPDLRKVVRLTGRVTLRHQSTRVPKRQESPAS